MNTSPVGRHTPRSHRAPWAWTRAALVLALGLSGIGRAAGARLQTPSVAQAQQPAPQQLAPLTAETRAAVVDSIGAALLDAYVFPDVAGKMADLIRGKLTRGEYDSLTGVLDFADQLTRDLQSISKDRHLRVVPVPPEESGGPPISDEEKEKRMVAQAAARNFGFERVERLMGNVGYLDFRNFLDAKYAGETAIAAMNFLGHCDAIIFDLRKNGGGWPSMIQLLSSYLFDEPTHLNSFYIRKGDKTDQYWTQASVRGPRLTKVPVYVLTSSFTFSGAEEFTYNLKNLKRGTIVGEVTGGGAHPVNRQIFAGLPIGMFLPFGRAVNPITGTNWEATGVEPDIKVPADEALTVAHREALKTLAAKAEDPEQKRSLEWALQGLELKATPPTLGRKELQAYAGSYGPRRVTLENGTLFYQRENGPRRQLLPAAKDLFFLDGVENFRAKFTRDAKGQIEKFVGLYDDGRTDENPRSGS